jgi:hypothetical protein
MPPGNENWRNNFRKPSTSLFDARVDLGVGALQIGVGHQARTAVTGPRDVDDVDVAVTDDAVQMGVDEIEARRGPQCPSSRGLMCPGASGSRSSGLSNR